MRIRMVPIIALLLTSATLAQTTRPVTGDDPMAAITALREELVDSFNKADMPRLLSHLDPDVVATWQNGEVTRGAAEVQQYYDKMMTGPDRRVQSARADPKVTDRHLYGDWAVSWGKMNDEFVMTDGATLKLDSRFTATIARRGEEWKVTSFHVSANVFDNPILGIAAKKAGLIAAAVAGVGGLIVGAVVGRILKRKPA